MAMSIDRETRVSEAVRFFENIHGGQQVKLAHAELLNRGKSNQSFVEGQSRFRAWGMGLENWLHRRMDKADDGVEIFYAPTPMGPDSNGKDHGRKKFQVMPSTVAFSDADYGLTPEVKARLVELGACLVRSGGRTEDRRWKYHVYLRLSRAVPLEELEKINRGLKVFINGDKFDATSLLRIPGTKNHKYPGSPMVRLERLADQTHRPEDMMTWFPVPKDYVGGVELEGMKMPTVPESFKTTDRKYWRLRKTLLHWNQRWRSGNVNHRYAAAIALVKDAIQYGFSVDVAYGFALECEPLLDKQEDENGYKIREDVAKIYYRNTKAQSSGLTVEEIQKEAGPESKAPKEKAASSTTPSTFASIDLGPDFPFAVPNLDELLAGEYKPLEPTLVQCGSFALLYPGKSHSLVADRGMGKTHIAIAMVHCILRMGGRVAYFDFEDTPDTFIRDRMMNQHGITAEMIRNQFLYMGGLVDHLEDLAGVVEDLAAKLRGWDLVIIDGVSASMGDIDGDWDDNKAVDYKKWHALMVQPFLDEEIATLQLDHSTKSGPRAGGTMQKGAKLTGVEYQVRVEGPHGFTIGRTGKVIIEAVKDRVGRIAKHRRKNPPAGHAGKDEWPWNDVATFTLASDDEGHITQALFEPINHSDADTSHTQPAQVAEDYEPTELEQKVIDTLAQHGRETTKTTLRKMVGGNATAINQLIDSMIQRGLLNSYQDGKTTKIAPALSGPQFGDDWQNHSNGTPLDFSKVKDRTKSGPKRECRNCGDITHIVKPDDIGYRPGVALCHDCASENISREPIDGPEWARKLRGRIDRSRRTRGRSDRS